jgi:hypothetical protein
MVDSTRPVKGETCQGGVASPPTLFTQVPRRGVLGSSRPWGVRSVFRKRTGGLQRAQVSRWAGAKHKDRHDEDRARRPVILGGCHRRARDFPRKRGHIVVGDMRTGPRPIQLVSERVHRGTSSEVEIWPFTTSWSVFPAHDPRRRGMGMRSVW